MACSPVSVCVHVESREARPSNEAPPSLLNVRPFCAHDRNLIRKITAESMARPTAHKNARKDNLEYRRGLVVDIVLASDISEQPSDIITFPFSTDIMTFSVKIK